MWCYCDVLVIVVHVCVRIAESVSEKVIEFGRVRGLARLFRVSSVETLTIMVIQSFSVGEGFKERENE